jgi:hypothetical protein
LEDFATKNMKWVGLIIIGMITMTVTNPKSYSDIFENSKKEAMSNVKIVIYQSGAKIILDPKSAYFNILLEKSEEILKNANSTFRLIVTKELISEIKRREAIEIVYPAPKTFSFLNRLNIDISCFLIPLKGRFADGRATIFYGTPEYSEFNVILSPTGTEDIKDIIKKIRDSN